MANSPTAGPLTSGPAPSLSTTRAGRSEKNGGSESAASAPAGAFQTVLEDTPPTPVSTQDQTMTPAQEEIVEEVEEVIEEVEDAIAEVEETIEIIATDEEVVENLVGQQQLEKAREIVEETKEKLEELKEDVEREPQKLTTEDVNRMKRVLGLTVNVGGRLTTFYGSSVTSATSWVTNGVNSLVTPSEDDTVSRNHSVVETDGQPGDGYYMTGVGVVDARSMAFSGNSEIPKNRPSDVAAPKGASESAKDVGDRISPTGHSGASIPSSSDD